MNALAKHTPGPWRIGDSSKTVFGPFTASPCPVTVAKMPEASPRCGVEERKANALLIAAAPDMLEALRSAASLLTDPDAGEDEANAVLAELEAAIHKATGKEGGGM